jgi:hypothetical protein
VSQLITSKGYPVIEYTVQTADGYLLGVQRIPYGIANANSTKYVTDRANERVWHLESDRCNASLPQCTTNTQTHTHTHRYQIPSSSVVATRLVGCVAYVGHQFPIRISWCMTIPFTLSLSIGRSYHPYGIERHC